MVEWLRLATGCKALLPASLYTFLAECEDGAVPATCTNARAPVWIIKCDQRLGWRCKMLPPSLLVPPLGKGEMVDSQRPATGCMALSGGR